MAIRITQAGVALTVGIIIVTGLIITGFFLVKNSGEQARREDAIKIAEQNLEKQSGNDVALNDDSTTPNKEDESSSAEPSQTTDDSALPSTGTSDTQVNSDASVDELPRTGIADTGAFISLGLVTFALASYYRSRRALFEAL